MSKIAIFSALSGIFGTISGVIVSHMLNKSGKVRLLPNNIHISCSQIPKNNLSNPNSVGLFHLDILIHVCLYNGKSHSISADSFVLVFNFNNEKIPIKCKCNDFINILPFSTQSSTLAFRENYLNDFPDLSTLLENSVIKFYGNGFIKRRTKIDKNIRIIF